MNRFTETVCILSRISFIPYTYSLLENCVCFGEPHRSIAKNTWRLNVCQVRFLFNDNDSHYQPTTTTKTPPFICNNCILTNKSQHISDSEPIYSMYAFCFAFDRPTQRHQNSPG